MLKLHHCAQRCTAQSRRTPATYAPPFKGQLVSKQRGFLANISRGLLCAHSVELVRLSRPWYIETMNMARCTPLILCAILVGSYTDSTVDQSRGAAGPVNADYTTYRIPIVGTDDTGHMFHGCRLSAGHGAGQPGRSPSKNCSAFSRRLSASGDMPIRRSQHVPWIINASARGALP